ncbi:stomatin-like protein 1 [Chrysemys picta bellii]|uniref:stomatin-like protein 1 n=1 Tax=Chrysemys picta bellii TaxID=8478 RepID=UPI0032B278D3
MMVKDLNAATRMMAQNAMTKTLLKKNLREIQMEKLRIGDQLLLEINDMTKSWGLEVDRVELILEAVLQPSQESLSGHLTMTPLIPGFEGLDSTIHQLAAHFFSNSMVVAAAASHETGNQPGCTSLSHACYVLCFYPQEDKTRTDSVVTVNEAEPPAPTITTTTSSSSRRKPSPGELLSAVELFLSESLVGAVGASYQFNIILLSGAWSTYFIDLTAGSGRIGLGDAQRNPDVILEMTENDLQSFFSGELHPLSAYMSGRLRVKGDLSVALKLEELFKAMKQHRERECVCECAHACVRRQEKRRVWQENHLIVKGVRIQALLFSISCSGELISAQGSRKTGSKDL